MRRRIWLAALAALGVLALGLLAAAVARCDLEAPTPTLLLLDRNSRFLGEVGASDDFGAGYWRLDAVPERVAQATILIEDKRFWRHPGVDVLAIGRAVQQNLRSARRVSGASTLAMQVARLQHPARRTYLNKLIEAVTALAMTLRNGREAVLRHYLTIVPYGNRIHGIAYAARRYLDKPVKDLSWAEVAFLAAIPQAPARMNPLDPAGRRRACRRARRILQRLFESGVINTPTFRTALAGLREIRIPRLPRRPCVALHAVLALERMLKPHRDEIAAESPIVRTTLDLDLQKELTLRVLEVLERWEALGAGNAALAVVDRSDWSVRAWVGSSDYFDTRHAGAIDYGRTPRSPGSALKPFIYALALERGVIRPTTVLDDIRRGPGGIGNADGAFLGPMLPRVALANSRNVPAADLVARIGVGTTYAFLRELGLHRGTVPPERWGLGLAIGNMPVTLERLLSAYTTLAGDGALHRLRWYRGQPLPPPRRLMSEFTARRITLFLADPMARLPEFPRMGTLEFPFPVAIKTGTSSGYHDAWTVAWSQRALAAAWVGHPDYRRMNGLSGYRSAARLVREALMLLHRDQEDGLEDTGFPLPRATRPVRLCALTGRRATAACDRVVVEYLASDEIPPEPCNAHLLLEVDRRTGRPATLGTPASEVERRTFVDLGPRYAAWQRAAGLPFPPGPPRPNLVRSRAPAPARIAVLSPEPGLRVLLDPETPRRLATLALEARVESAAPQAVWTIDGLPYATVRPPFTARWPLAPGEHTVQLWIPTTGQHSRRIRFTVENP